MSYSLTPFFLQLHLVANLTFNKLVQFVSKSLPREQIKVVVDQGTIIGLKYKTILSNKPYISFLGVPYAKPPIDDLRFKPPVKHPGWSGELKAFSEGNKCVQYALKTNKIIGNEDCLYLNIFIPQDELNEKKAVMVFIHGGAFNFGSSSLDEFSPDYLLDENVIVVTINYRLNSLGFLNFDIDECPGNMGLKDQLFAIKWINANISAFGGNSENITIFGESAGAASVHYHTMCPQSTGLFQKAIIQSGCVFNNWALNTNHKETAFELAKKLGCQKDNPQEIVQYLKSLPANDLVKYTKFDKDECYPVFKFLPSIENDKISNKFIPAHPAVLVKTATPIPIITGINNLEGMFLLNEVMLKNLENLYTTEEMIKFFKTYIDISKTQFIEEDTNKIKNFYLNKHNQECETTKLENICHLFSDFFFIKDFHHGFDHFIKKEITPVYNYEFKFDGEINSYKNLMFYTKPALQRSLKGACHGDDLCYLFYAQLFRNYPKAKSQEFRMCRMMSKLWTNFAKNGNPNSSELSFEWKNTSANNPKYLLIDGDNTNMVNELLYSSRIKFWNEIRIVDTP